VVIRMKGRRCRVKPAPCTRPGVIGAPKHRRGSRPRDPTTGLPAGTEVFLGRRPQSRWPTTSSTSASPTTSRDHAPPHLVRGRRVSARPSPGNPWWSATSALCSCNTTIWAGAATNNIEARVAVNSPRNGGRQGTGVPPTRWLALFHYPDKDLRERIFRIYNETHRRRPGAL